MHVVAPLAVPSCDDPTAVWHEVFTGDGGVPVEVHRVHNPQIPKHQIETLQQVTSSEDGGLRLRRIYSQLHNYRIAGNFVKGCNLAFCGRNVKFKSRQYCNHWGIYVFCTYFPHTSLSRYVFNR